MTTEKIIGLSKPLFLSKCLNSLWEMLQGWLSLPIETLCIFSPVTVYRQVSWFLLPKDFHRAMRAGQRFPLIPNDKYYGWELRFPTEVFPWGSHNTNRCQPKCPLPELWRHRLKFHLRAECVPESNAQQQPHLPLPQCHTSPSDTLPHLNIIQRVPLARNFPATGLSWFIHHVFTGWLVCPKSEAIILYP